MLFNRAALFEALTLQAATEANVGVKSKTYTAMSDAIKIVNLPSDQQELLLGFLQHAKEDPEGWVPAGNYDGMDQYAKDIYHRISRILTLSERCTLLRICGQPPNPKYFFDAGGLIPIAGKGYSASDGHQNVELVLGAKGHISKEIAVQVQDGCTFYLLWIVKKE